MKRIVLTGGGPAGHVTPNIALIPELKRSGWEIHYIGTKNGIEHRLMSCRSDIIYHSIQAGKLRRYMDIKNFTDPFRIICGTGQSIRLIRNIGPRVIFSKGGFVSVPVAIGGFLNHVPVIVHESDISPGLANRIASFLPRLYVPPSLRPYRSLEKTRRYLPALLYAWNYLMVIRIWEWKYAGLLPTNP